MGEVVCTITEIKGTKDTKAGKVQEIGIKEASLNKDYTVSVFLNDGEFDFNKGEEVTMNLSSKDWKGKIYYSTSLSSIDPIKKLDQPAPEPEEEGKVPQSVWEEKDRRIARESVLKVALEIVKMNLKTEDKLANSEITNLVTLEAETLEQWIYRDQENAPF